MSDEANTKAHGNYSATLHIETREGMDHVEIRLTFSSPPDVDHPATAHHLAGLAYQAISDYCGPAFSMRRARHH